MTREITKAILRTLLYSDIFDYPLKKAELFRFLIQEKKIDKKTFLEELSKKNANVVFKKNFYCIKGHEDIIAKRIKKEKESLAKFKIARRVINRICFFPTILFIGISGALAMKNSEKNDDIDLFVITCKNTIWLTRFFLIATLKIMGKYRKRGDKNVADKFCLNMFLDESQLELPLKRQNLYSAHEIVQLMPIFERNNTYKKFINANNWIRKFLPNSIDIKREKSPNLLGSQFFNILEYLSKKIQLYIMKKHITNETISDNFLAFHPVDYNTQTLSLYKKRLRKYGL